jgi:uncharacterized metal-binding protein YceD (DUF177 family)
MKKQLPIYIERLRQGRVQEITETIDPKQLDFFDDEIIAAQDLVVVGEAYLADPYLLIKLTIKSEFTLLCSVCNEPFSFPIEVVQVLHEEPVEEITDSIFDLLPLIRETVLLEAPFYPLCGGSTCHNRAEIEKFFKKQTSVNEGDERYKPFENL